jgi:hypothetical protein
MAGKCLVLKFSEKIGASSEAVKIRKPVEQSIPTFALRLWLENAELYATGLFKNFEYFIKARSLGTYRDRR